MKKSLFLIFCALLIILLISGCAYRIAKDADSPEKVVAIFLNSLKNGNTRAAYSLLSARVQRQVSMEDFAESTKDFSDFSDLFISIMKTGVNKEAANIYASTYQDVTHYRTELLTVDRKTAMVGFALFAPDVNEMDDAKLLLLQYFVQLARSGASLDKLEKTIKEYWAVLPKTQQSDTTYLKLTLIKGYWRLDDNW